MFKTVAMLVIGSGTQATSNAVAALLATAFLPPSERGAMVIALAVASLASIICGLGTGFSLRLLLPSHSNPEKLLTAYSSFTLGASILAVLLAISALSLFDVGGFALSAACGVYTAVLLVNLQLTEARFAFGRLRAGAYWATANAAGGLAGIVIGLAVDQYDSQLLLYQAAGCAAVSGVNLVSMMRHRLVIFGVFRLEELRELARVGFAPLVWGLGIVVISKVDRLVLGHYRGEEIVAAYALAVTVAEMIRLVPTAFSQLITKDLASRQSSKLPVLMIVGSVASALVLGALAVPVTGWAVYSFLDPVYRLTVSLLLILVVGEVFMALYITCARSLQGLGLSAITARLGLAAMVVVLPVYIWVSPHYGERGVAVALASAYASLGLAALALLVYAGRSRGRAKTPKQTG